MKKTNVKKLAVSAAMLAIGFLLPLLTAQIKVIGDTLLPMHLPVMLCGLLCGPQYGAIVGFLLPFLRSAFFSMPPIYPNAVWMSLELMTYGLVIGLVYGRGQTFNLWRLYIALITAMLSGRVVWGITKAVLLGVAGRGFTVGAFLVGGFADAVPGIILQLIFIPLIMKILDRTRLTDMK